MKKKFWSRLSVLFLTVAMVLTALTGCASAGELLGYLLDALSTDVTEDPFDTDSSLILLTETPPAGSESEAPSDITDASNPDETDVPGRTLDINGSYTTKEDVALYIHLYKKLPSNFISKTKARELGWTSESLEPYAPGKCIGGSVFYNNEGKLPEKQGRIYHECDIDTLGAAKRGVKRIVFSNDGLIYYTENHYEDFELLYGDPNA